MAELQAGRLITVDGLQLQIQFHWPVGSPCAALLVVHGAGDHSGRYQRALDALVPQGIAVITYDQRGYGRSPGRRGHIDTWQQYRQDLDAAIRHVSQEIPAAPLFLWGYSMGGLVVADAILHDVSHLSGAILMSAPFQPVGVASPAQRIASQALAALWPTFRFKLRLDMADITRDAAIIHSAAQDPWMHPYASARWGAEALKTVTWVNRHAGEVALPLLILHGEEDRLCAVAAARRFYEQVPFADKTLITYPRGYHELHNDLMYEQVLVDMARWIERHLPASALAGQAALAQPAV